MFNHPTVNVTVAVAHTGTASQASYVHLSVPENPSLGTYTTSVKSNPMEHSPLLATDVILLTLSVCPAAGVSLTRTDTNARSPPLDT